MHGYIVGPEIGRDSAGVVVAARDRVTGTDVAIRWLPPELSGSPEFMMGLRTDVNRLSDIDQANLVQVYELVEDGGEAALVTELVDGPSVRALIDRGRLPAEAAVHIAIGALSGLAALHDRGVLHRAIRPESVRVGRNGDVKLVDIGLAPPSTVGGYTAPDVLAGGPPSTFSDVYAVYAVLLECVLGDDSQPDGLGVPTALRVVFSIGLADDPEARYADADAALNQLKLLAAAEFGAQWSTFGRESLERFVSQLAAGPNPSPMGPPVMTPPVPDRPIPDPPVPAPRVPMPPPPATGIPSALASPSWFDEPLAPAERLAIQTVAARTVAPPTASSVAPLPMRSWVEPVGGPAAEPVRSAPASSWTGLPTGPSPVVGTPGGAVGSPSALRPPAGHRPKNGPTSSRRKLILVAAALLLAIAGTSWAMTGTQDSAGSAPAAVTTNVRVPMATTPGPVVPVPSAPGGSADTSTPTTPAGLRVTGRSTTAVSLGWAMSTDNVKVIGYVVSRDGRQVGSTADPGFTDNGLSPHTRYTYVVTAFDEAGNMSPASRPVSATTLAEPDISPPTVPVGLRATGRSVTSIVLGWTASQDNVGVTGYEVYRNGTVIASVSAPGYTDGGLAPATSYTYRIRAFDASNNSSADSAPITVSTLQAPDTTPPSAPAGLGAIATGPTTIDLSWLAATDAIGVSGYQVVRNGTKVADVAGTVFTDQGLSPATDYTYSVMAFDAAGNVSGPSAPATARTASLPPSPSPTVSTEPPNPPAEIMSVELTATVTSDCRVILEATVKATGPMDSVLLYDINGVTGSEPLTFTITDLSRVVTLPEANASEAGLARAEAGGQSDMAGWSVCPPPSAEASLFG